MSSHAETELLRLKSGLSRLGDEVRTSLDQALRVLQDPDPTLAQGVIQRDTRIDEMEVALEQQCQDYLALLQPVAVDLRTVISVLKINADLERIADQAGNIARQVQFVLRSPARGATPLPLIEQGRLAGLMLQDVLAAWETLDAELARKVIVTDRQVDEIHRSMHLIVEQSVGQQPERLAAMISYLKISRELERIADHCVNIAQDILYLVRGQIARHVVQA